MKEDMQRGRFYLKRTHGCRIKGKVLVRKTACMEATGAGKSRFAKKKQQGTKAEQKKGGPNPFENKETGDISKEQGASPADCGAQKKKMTMYLGHLEEGGKISESDAEAKRRGRGP